MTKKRPDKTGMVDTYAPSISLLVKLGSLAVHVDEYFGGKGHSFDEEAMETIIWDREVRAWLAAMDAVGFLPIRRDGIRYKDPA